MLDSLWVVEYVIPCDIIGAISLTQRWSRMIALGTYVEHLPSGDEGYIVGKTEYLDGFNRVLVGHTEAGPADRNINTGIWVDEDEVSAIPGKPLLFDTCFTVKVEDYVPNA